MGRRDPDQYENDGYLNREHLGSGTAASNNFLRGDHVWATIPAGTAAGSYNLIAAGSQTAATSGTVYFNNGGGVSFGMANNSVVTASVQTNYLTTAALSDHSHSNYLTTAMASNQGSDFVAASAAFAGTSASGTIASNGISVSIGPYITTGRASNDGVGLATALTAGPLAWTVDSAGISLNAGSAAGTTSGFAGNSLGGSMTHNSAGLNLSLSHPAWITTAAQVSHSHGNPTLALTNLTGTTASASNGFTLSLSAAAPGAGGGAAISAGANSQSTGTVNFANSNNITFGLSNNGTMTASFNPVNIGMSTNGNTAGTTGTFDGAGLQYVFIGGNNITLSQSSSSLSVSLSIIAAAPGGAATQSYHAFPDMANNTVTTSFGQSTSYVCPFVLSQPLSIDRIRMVYSGSVAASSTQATTGNTSLSMSGITSHNLVFYSRGNGANSLSLQYLTSTQVVDRQLFTISYAANSTQHSYSNRFTLGSASFTKDYSSSVNSVHYHTSNLTDLTGVKYIDLPVGLSLNAGQYWIAYGRSTTRDTQNGSISVATRCLVSHNTMVAVSQNTLAMGMLGGATNSSVGWLPAHGSFTTGGVGGTTSSITMANVSTLASNLMLYVQMMRIT